MLAIISYIVASVNEKIHPNSVKVGRHARPDDRPTRRSDRRTPVKNRRRKKAGK